MEEDKFTKNKNYSPIIWRVMATATAWIVGPVIFGFFLGNFLDKEFNTSPWLLLLSLGICFITSMIALTLNALKEVKKMDSDVSDKNVPDNNIKDNNKSAD